MQLRKWILTLSIITASLLVTQAAVAEDNSFDASKIEFVDLDGNTSTLADYKGKWVIVNLWATWCPPCLVEIPDLVLFHEEHKDKDAIVLGVNHEVMAPEKVKNFSEELMINYPIVRFKGDFDNSKTPFGKLKGLPTTYMVTPEGKVVAARTGMVDDKMLKKFINEYASMTQK